MKPWQRGVSCLGGDHAPKSGGLGADAIERSYYRKDPLSFQPNNLVGACVGLHSFAGWGRYAERLVGGAVGCMPSITLTECRRRNAWIGCHISGTGRFSIVMPTTSDSNRRGKNRIVRESMVILYGILTCHRVTWIRVLGYRLRLFASRVMASLCENSHEASRIRMPSKYQLNTRFHRHYRWWDMI